MKKKINLIADKLSKIPRRIFLIDGLGGLLTTLMLFAVLAQFEEHFGMPIEVVRTLGFIACLYMFYSFSCYLFLNRNHRPYLKFIISANSAYCLLTLGLVCYFYNSLTILGILYFITEILLIMALVFVERIIHFKIL